MGLTLKEMAALALAGYKKKDIDAKLEKEEAEAAKGTEDTGKEPETVEENEPKEVAEDNPGPDEGSGDDDIQKQLEEAQKQVKDLTAKLEKAQKDNTKKDVDDHKDAAAERDKRLAERARSMM